MFKKTCLADKKAIYIFHAVQLSYRIKLRAKLRNKNHPTIKNPREILKFTK